MNSVRWLGMGWEWEWFHGNGRKWEEQ